MPENVFDKPYKSYDQLIDKLKNKGIAVNDPELTKYLLSYYGYDQLINSFRFPENNVEDNIQNIIAEYIIDSEFKSVILDGILLIENHFKNLIGHEVAKAFQVNDHSEDDNNNPDNSIASYLNPNHYVTHNKDSVTSFIRDKVLTTNENPTKQYRKNMNHVPPWILMQNMTFGTAIRYYKILPNTLKSTIVNQLIYSPTPDTDINIRKALFVKCLNMLSIFRNSSAHTGRPLFSCVNGDALERNCYPNITWLETFWGLEAISGSGLRSNIKKDIFLTLLFILELLDLPALREQFIDNVTNINSKYLSGNKSTQKLYIEYLKIAKIPKDYVERLQVAFKFMNTI